MADQPDQNDDFPEQLGALIRRVLHQDEHEARVPDELPPEPVNRPDAPDTVRSPIPGYNRPARPPEPPGEDDSPVSPIRPAVNDDIQPQAPLTPSVPDRKATSELSPREQLQRVEEALINLREKMSQVAAEYAAGTINQAQFDAIYTRYSEQRDITERLLARDPGTDAWQSVIQSGHTQFLREHYEARVISYAIYDQVTAALISVTGPLQIKSAQARAVIARLRAVRERRGDNPGPAQKKLADGRTVLFVPGALSVAAVIFSRTPAAGQVNRVQDMHRDFERANQHALRQQDYATGRMVFPHRALFEH